MSKPKQRRTTFRELFQRIGREIRGIKYEIIARGEHGLPRRHRKTYPLRETPYYSSFSEESIAKIMEPVEESMAFVKKFREADPEDAVLEHIARAGKIPTKYYEIQQGARKLTAILRRLRALDKALEERKYTKEKAAEFFDGNCGRDEFYETLARAHVHANAGAEELNREIEIDLSERKEFFRIDSEPPSSTKVAKMASLQHAHIQHFLLPEIRRIKEKWKI